MQDSATTLTMTKDDLEGLIYKLDEMNFQNVWSLNLNASSDIETVSIQDNDQERWAAEIREVLKSDVRTKSHGSIVFWSDLVKLIINPPVFFSRECFKWTFRIPIFKTNFQETTYHRRSVATLGLLCCGIISRG